MGHHKRQDQDRWHQLVAKLPSRCGNRHVTGGPCQKRTYASKQAAKLALRKVRGVRRDQLASGERDKGAEDHSYRCPICSQWHLTSQKWR